MPLLACGGCIKDIFVSEEEMINKFTGQELWLWGLGPGGGLGNNSNTVSASSPIQTVSGGTNWKSVSSGGFVSAAIKTDGTLWLWGAQTTGSLGNNSPAAVSSPVQTVSAGTNWKCVTSSNGGTVAAIKTDGSFWAWGLNSDGELGNNTRFNASSPIQTISSGTNWKTVSNSGYMVGGIKTDGTLWLWGRNVTGSLGNNNSTILGASSPVQTISAGTNWKIVSLASQHAGAIKNDGTLWMWGIGSQGSLGRNNAIDASSPVQTISAGTNWKTLSASTNVTAAIKTDGTLWLWGRNNYGGLGNNTILSTSSPIQTVSGGTNWQTVTAGERSAAIKTDGSLWLWGKESCGTLGRNTTSVCTSSPVQTISVGTNWRSVSINSTIGTAATKISEF